MSFLNKPSKVTLHYFNARGKAEIIRFILHFAKVDFVDDRVNFEDWPKKKASMPLGQLPVVEFQQDNKTLVLCQSSSIVRTLATKFGLCGSSFEEAIKADEAYESLKEIFDALSRAYFQQDNEAKMAQHLQIFTEILPRIFTFLEQRLSGENGGKSLAGGDELTYADVALASLYDWLNLMPRNEFTNRDRIRDDYPRLRRLAKNVVDISPQLRQHIVKRPQTGF